MRSHLTRPPPPSCTWWRRRARSAPSLTLIPRAGAGDDNTEDLSYFSEAYHKEFPEGNAKQPRKNPVPLNSFTFTNNVHYCHFGPKPVGSHFFVLPHQISILPLQMQQLCLPREILFSFGWKFDCIDFSLWWQYHKCGGADTLEEEKNIFILDLCPSAKYIFLWNNNHKNLRENDGPLSYVGT